MKRLILLAAVLLIHAPVHAKEGDWSNFVYITTYGDSNFWTATDVFDGGTGSNAFNHPQGILATTSAVYVADTGNDRIVKLGYRHSVILTPEPSNVWEMFYVSEWGTSGTGSNQLNFPTDLAFGTNGMIYIVDSSNNCIKICDTEGNWHGSFGSFGSGTNQFACPTGICTVPTNGCLVIADYGNDRVLEYTCDGQFVRELVTIPNYPNTPQIESVHYELIFGPYDVLVVSSNLYVTEAGRKDASQYKSKSRVKGANDANRFILVNYDDFNYIADWNLPETNVDCLIGGWTGNVMQGIRGLTDFEGLLLFACADNSQNQYIIADDLGYIVGKFGTDVISGAISPSPLEGEFGYPYNLARAGNFVFCADSGNNRVSMWKKNTLPLFDYPKTNWFEVREMQVLSFTVHAIDEDGDAITYGGALDPAGDGKNWGVNSDYLKFSFIPNYGDAGTDFTLALNASDGMGSATMDVTIHVNPVNPKHKKLVKQKPNYYEDYVYDSAEDGDLIKLSMKKSGTINHWDGSVLNVSGTPKVALKAKRSKKLSGQGYDKLYGEIDATNEYTLGSVAQLDVVCSQEELRKVANRGTIGRVILPETAPLGSVIVKGGDFGGADAMTIRSIKVTRRKIKDVITKQKRSFGGNISARYYPGNYGRIRAYGLGKKNTSIISVSTKGGNISNTWIHAKGHIRKVAAKVGKDELKLPVGGSLEYAIVRAGVEPQTFAMQQAGDVVRVQVSDSIECSSLIGAADPGDGTFEGKAIDATEVYVGSVAKIKHGKTGSVNESLIVSKDAIKKIDKLTIDPTTKVIIDGIVQ